MALIPGHLRRDGDTAAEADGGNLATDETEASSGQ
jgi:hypothetical protein